MADLSPAQLAIVGLVVVIAVVAIVFGLRRGSLRSAQFRGLGVRARVDGAPEAKQLPGQTVQTDDFTAKRSYLRIVKGARTSFRRTRFENSVLDIVPDNGPAAPERPAAQPDASPDQSTP
ncbi:hypothetical protein [Streptomyces sp. HPF1205]|uniref:hypothetical protein n=1 Tax=Streptomyces sp. HPF1205 TaxID=2873262 RepID=UPI001CED3F46|nr:hypothetical protein [Streptomyces sp. HPF1205]